jgi:hypothetical protein
MNKLAILLVNAYYVESNWALQEVQHTVHKNDNQFFPYFEIFVRILG